MTETGDDFGDPSNLRKYFRVRVRDSGGGSLWDSREEAEEEIRREEAAEPDDHGSYEIVEEWHMPGDVKAMPDFDGGY